MSAVEIGEFSKCMLDQKPAGSRCWQDGRQLLKPYQLIGLDCVDTLLETELSVICLFYASIGHNDLIFNAHRDCLR